VLICKGQRAVAKERTGAQAKFVHGKPVAASPGKPIAASHGTPVAASPGRPVSAFAIYHLPGAEVAGLSNAMGELGLESLPLAGGTPLSGPRLLLLPQDRPPPPGWEDWSVNLPDGAGTSVLLHMLRMALEMVVAKHRLSELEQEHRRHQLRFDKLNRIGMALSSEREIDKLHDLILRSCRQLTGADGASLWIVEEGEADSRIVRFASTQNHSLEVPYSSFTVPLTQGSMVGYTILSGRSQLVEDSYNLPPGTPYQTSRAFDQQHGYRSKSMMCVPMTNHEGQVVGAIQLVNAKTEFETRLSAGNVDTAVEPFHADDLEMVESIASQAAVALDNKMLLDSIQALFEGFVKASVTAIESRDPTTYGHSGRVAALTVGIAEALNAIGTGALRDTRFDREQLRELRYAALLHDFGKIGVREHVLVKEKKLYPAQMDFIRARFGFVQRSAQLRSTQEKLRLAMAGAQDPQMFEELDRRLATELEELRQWMDAVFTANEPSILDEDKASMLEFLAQRTYQDLQDAEHPLLEPDEFHFLSIKRGTLDERERLEIESHVTNSYRFLTKIPWTGTMREVPRIAYGHHEKLDGSGYPRRLVAADIPVQTRMMTISDIYDALTATDRPYKRAVPVERALAILKMEADEQKLDAGLLDVFIAKRVYEAAADYRPDSDLLMGAEGR